jgi:2',3'-cyclic-nucleotide 2'-phosphodiesterase/3'-nucleotidase
VKKINGKTLKAYLEKCAEYFEIENDEIVVNNKYIYPKLQHFNYDMVDGIDYTIKVSNDIGNRIVELKYKGKDIKEEDSFSIVLNNYRSSGGGDFSMIKDSKVIKEIQTSMVEILAKYILKNKVIDFEPVNNINVIK